MSQRAESIALAFIDGGARTFPSVAFHDGYRGFDDRILGWMSNDRRRARSPSEGEASERMQKDLDEYAAGALARILEKLYPMRRTPRSQSITVSMTIAQAEVVQKYLSSNVNEIREADRRKLLAIADRVRRALRGAR